MTTTILIAIAAFLAITLVLVALLLYAKAKLTSSGDVVIDINGGEKVITTESGSTLLSTLANNKVFLPSACGGGGSCGMCKCQVLEGGGDILPTETGFISRKLAKDHWRLGCQVKVKENMKIRVPEAVLGVKKWECTVVSNRNISTFLKEFVVKLPEGENLKFRSGGYIQIDIPKYDAIKFSSMDVDEKFRADWDKFKMWDLVLIRYKWKSQQGPVFLYRNLPLRDHVHQHGTAAQAGFSQAHPLHHAGVSAGAGQQDGNIKNGVFVLAVCLPHIPHLCPALPQGEFTHQTYSD